MEKQADSSAFDAHPDAQRTPIISDEVVGTNSSNPVSNTVLEGWRLYTVQLSLCLSLLLGSMDSSIVSTALVTIGKDFDDFLRLQWIVLAYLLTYLAFAFIFARLSDVVGRKWASISAVAILTAGSLGAGLSRTMTQLIGFRALQGIGGSGVYPLPFTVLPEITPPARFAMLSAISGIMFTCSAVLAPTLGGVITTDSSWRWIFLFNYPVGVFIIALMLFAWPHTLSAGKMSWRQLDIAGCFLFVAASVLLIFVLQEAGAGAYPWSSVIIVASLTIATTAALALCFWTWYLSSATRYFAPLFPARIVTNRVLIMNLLVSTLVGYVMFTSLIELPEHFQIINGKNSKTAGIDLLPLLGATALASGVGGWLSSGEGNRSFLTLTTCCAFMVLGSALMSTVGDGDAIPHYLYAYEVLLGFVLGGALVSSILVVKLNAKEEDAASAQGLQSQARILGGNLGLAIATIILNSHLASDLTSTLTPQQLSDLRRSLNAIETFNAREVAAVAQAFAGAFKSQLQACAGISAACFVFSLLAWQRNPPSWADLAKKAEERRKETRTAAEA